jgi:hypothetical protein
VRITSNNFIRSLDHSRDLRSNGGLFRNVSRNHRREIDVALMPSAAFLDSRCGHRLISAPVDAGVAFARKR